ncbi:MAG: hypothetical protein JRF33_26025, partial [Deltaproteobacteria bacterium]|nr:hypothetical protein [Deltaproteobacteria bacterium]
GCPEDANKIEAGVCGCGVSDTDGDGDTTPDCVDGCPEDANKIEAGVCGCGVSDTDSDLDSWHGCLDNCPDVSNEDQSDLDSDGRGDACDGLFVQMSGGRNHTCGIRVDGTLWCWGHNHIGQLGVPSVWWSGNPVQVGEDADWKAVEAAGDRSCGIRLDGSLWCWGHNNYALGDGTLINRPEPVRIGLANDWLLVAPGSDHSCGIRGEAGGGSLWCWGQNQKGQLGVELDPVTSSPVRVGTAEDWRHVAVGSMTTCGIRGDGQINRRWCWGHNWLGILGVGDNVDRHEPTLADEFTDWETVSLGETHACGLRNSGDLNTLWCWGYCNAGQLGLGSTWLSELSPVQVDEHATWLSILSGQYHSCGQRVELGEIKTYCWGSNRHGQLADGSRLNSTVPEFVPHALSGSFLALGYNHTCVFSDSGQFCWGLNDHGEVGNGIHALRMMPERVGEDADWVHVNSGHNHGCGIQLGGRSASLWCWGANNSAQLGDGSKIDQAAPVLVGEEGYWTQIELGRSLSCGIRDDGLTQSLWCWGLPDLRPARMGEYDDWSALDLGSQHGCGLRQEAEGNSLWCWGSNYLGQLGNGSTNFAPDPQQSGEDTDWVDIASFNYRTCGIRDDGVERSLWCWGWDALNGYSGGSSLHPLRVGDAGDWEAIQLGDYSACGLRAGEVWCWGLSSGGSLGLGDWSGRSLPTQVTSGGNWTQLTMGFCTTCAMEQTPEGDQLWCWGCNRFGQLGDDTLENKNIPIPVGGPGQWARVSTGGYHICAVDQEGGLWCWGDNQYGQLGHGDPWQELPAPIAW